MHKPTIETPGAIRFRDLEDGAKFYFGTGDYIFYKIKTGYDTYKEMGNKWTMHVDPDTIVFRDESKYVG